MDRRLLVASVLGVLWLIGSAMWLLFGKITIFSMRAPFKSEFANRLFLTVVTSIYDFAVLGWIVPLAYCVCLLLFRRR